LAGPVAGDGRGVVLAVARRAVRIREGDDVARAGVDLPVAAEGVRPLRLRPAVNVDDQRVLLRRVEVVRLDDEDVDLLAVRALHPHLLRRADVHFAGDG